MPDFTVGEAIELLQKYPKEWRLLVDGFEGGYDDPEVHGQEVVLMKNRLPWNGPYDDAANFSGTPFKAVIFGRNKTNG